LTHTVTFVTITDITVTFMATVASSESALTSIGESRAAARRELKRELERMSAAMVQQKGLLNHAQAALMLDVSTKRVGELVRLGKLERFDFAGRTYVSMQQVWDRIKEMAAEGRPRRPTGKRIAAQLKAAFKTDRLQASLGGYAGPYHKKKRQEFKAREREKSRERWRMIREAHGK
jgi:hypothetical protein